MVACVHEGRPLVVRGLIGTDPVTLRQTVLDRLLDRIGWPGERVVRLPRREGRAILKRRSPFPYPFPEMP